MDWKPGNSEASLPMKVRHQLFWSVSSLGQSSSFSSEQDRFRTLTMGWIQDVVCVTWLEKNMERRLECERLPSYQPNKYWSWGHCFYPDGSPWDRKQAEPDPGVLSLGDVFRVFCQRECRQMYHVKLAVARSVLSVRMSNDCLAMSIISGVCLLLSFSRGTVCYTE